jgi:hypothetical protein
VWHSTGYLPSWLLDQLDGPRGAGVGQAAGAARVERVEYSPLDVKQAVPDTGELVVRGCR